MEHETNDQSEQQGEGREDSELEIRVEQLGTKSLVIARLRATADYCYRTFCNVDLIPSWLWVVDTAVVHERDEQDRAVRVSFMGALERASVGYSLGYGYDDRQREVRWHLVGRGVKQLAGWARFTDLPADHEDAPRRCRLDYCLETALTQGLPPWADQLYQSKPAETVVADFCEFVLQRLRAQG